MPVKVNLPAKHRPMHAKAKIAAKVKALPKPMLKIAQHKAEKNLKTLNNFSKCCIKGCVSNVTSQPFY
jgi:hypothetical protein